MSTAGQGIFGQSQFGAPQATPIAPNAPTYGQVRFELSKEFPGADPDLLDSYIVGRFRQMVRRTGWSDLLVSQALQTAIPYTTGTVTLTVGSKAVSLTGGVFLQEMTGLFFRAGGDSGYYTFMWTSDTTGTLDRPYDGAATGPVGFWIFQRYYTLPSFFRYEESVSLLSPQMPLSKITPDAIDASAPSRVSFGCPRLYSYGPSTGVTTQQRQFELYPIPDKAYDVVVKYKADLTMFGPGDTSLYFPEWVDPDCLKAGVRADLGKAPSPEYHEGLFEFRLSKMMLEEGKRQGAKRFSMARRFTRHRTARLYR